MLAALTNLNPFTVINSTMKPQQRASQLLSKRSHECLEIRTSRQLILRNGSKISQRDQSEDSEKVVWSGVERRLSKMLAKFFIRPELQRDKYLLICEILNANFVNKKVKIPNFLRVFSRRAHLN